MVCSKFFDFLFFFNLLNIVFIFIVLDGNLLYENMMLLVLCIWINISVGYRYVFCCKVLYIMCVINVILNYKVYFKIKD